MNLFVVEYYEGCYSISPHLVTDISTASDYDDAREVCHSSALHYTGLYGSPLSILCLDEEEFQQLTAAPQHLCNKMSTDEYLAGGEANNTLIITSVYQTFCK